VAAVRHGEGFNYAMEPVRVLRDDYEITTDKRRLDLGYIHDFLANRSYWAGGIPRGIVERSIEHSLCFGLYHRGTQVGFARVVTDCATVAYLADVFVDEAHRGSGLGTWLIATVLDYPGLSGLRMILLGTRDAHGLYERYGFVPVEGTALAERMMAIRDPDPYGREGR
jgi:GNAT superfamily N-acetyltransferase